MVGHIKWVRSDGTGYAIGSNGTTYYVDSSIYRCHWSVLVPGVVVWIVPGLVLGKHVAQNLQFISEK